MLLRYRPGSLVLLTLLLCAVAQASKPRCRLERIVRLDDRVEALAAVVEIEGEVVEKAAREYVLLANGKAAGRGERAELVERSKAETYVVLAVEISALYAPSMDKIKEALTEFLEALPPRSKAKLIAFGNEIDDRGAFVPAVSLSSAVDELNPDDEGEVQLMTAVSAGLRALNKVKDRDKELRAKDKDAAKRPQPRLLMIALSDGLNPVMDRRRFRDLGDQLRRSGVSFFPIAFSPRDDRGPLLNLGELAKRASGTFRWAEKPEQIKERLHSLAEELKQTQVLTFRGKKVEKLVPEDPEEFTKTTFALRCADLASNAFRSGDAPFEQPSRWWKYLLGVLGALVGLWAMAQGLVFLLNRRAARAPIAQMPAAAAPVAYPAPTGGYPAAMGGAPAPLRAAQAMLVMIGGALGGQRIPIGEALVIGKSVTGPGTLQIADDPTVSGRHCEVRRQGPGFVLIDLGSTNGTFANDQRLGGPAALQDGNLVRLGTGTQFKFRLD